MTRLCRALKGVVCLLLALCLLVSSAYLMREAFHPHDCDGEACPICALILRVEQIGRGLGLLLALSAARLAVYEASRFCVHTRKNDFSPFTPVRLMVRMND